jgi:hypothetical protein
MRNGTQNKNKDSKFTFKTPNDIHNPHDTEIHRIDHVSTVI